MKTKVFATNIQAWDCQNNLARTNIDFDNMAGEFSREEWLENLTNDPCDGGYGLAEEEAREICNILNNTSNTEFFRK